MKQITGATGPSSPPGPVQARARGLDFRRIALFAVVFLVVLFAVNRFLHRENHYEHLADQVTKAIAANDMRPVEGEFNALRRPQLEDRGKVGRLSDFVNAEGAFKSVKEDTPAGSQAGYHHFTAHFAKGDLAEDMTLDADGKIADFHVKPLN
jgi:hypothetical protein